MELTPVEDQKGLSNGARIRKAKQYNYELSCSSKRRKFYKRKD